MTGYFTSYAGQKYQVTVGNASGTLYMGEDPVHLTWDRPDHIFVSLRTMSANIRVKSSIDLGSLYTDDPLGCAVRIDAVDSSNVVTSCVFFGYLVPQEWDAPFSGLNDEVELMAVDALAILKQLKYTAAETYYPSLLTSQSILDRACTMLGLTTVTLRSSSRLVPEINESTFLPSNQDVSEYSEDRMSWYDVLSAIATWEGYVFMQDTSNALNLLAVDVEDVVTNGTPTSVDMRGEDSRSSDVRMSIEPAKSRIQVNYQDLSAMEIVPEITEKRMEDTILDETTISDGTKKTHTYFFVSKDWTGELAGCGAVVSLTDSSDDSSEKHACIVGPATTTYPRVNTQSVSLFAPVACIQFSVWARNDMVDDANGYPQLAVKTQPSNFNPEIELRVYNPVLGTSSTYTRTLNIEGQEGFTSAKVLIYSLLDTTSSCYGYIRMKIPEGCVITDLSCDLAEDAYGLLAADTKTKLSEVANDGIVELRAAGWNDSLTIDARLRSCYNGYSAADVVNSGIWDKFPFCKTDQFESPRRRFKTTINGIFAPMALISDSNVSAQRMLADGGDIDLRQDETTLDLIETWVSV